MKNKPHESPDCTCLPCTTWFFKKELAEALENKYVSTPEAMEKAREYLEAEIEKWKAEPFYIPVLPIPLTYIKIDVVLGPGDVAEITGTMTEIE